MKLKITLTALAIIAVFCFQYSYAQESKSITISEGIKMVLKDNRLVKAALFDEDIAFEDSLLSRSALLPNLSANVIKTFNQFQPASKISGANVFTADKDPYSFGFDVYQTLFDFNKSLYGYRAAKQLSEAHKANTETVRKLATLEFIIAYFDLLETEKMIAVAEKEAESLAAYLSDAQHLYEHGVVVQNDLLPAKVRLADAKQKLISVRNSRETAAGRLNNILALPIRGEISAQDIRMAPPQLPEIEEAFKIAQKQRPEVMFFEDRIKASVLNETVKKFKNFPVIFADAGYAFTKNQYLVNEGNSYVKLGAKADLYDGGAAQADLAKERARGKQLKEQKDKLIEDIKFEVEDSFLGLKNACEKALVAKEALAQAEENVRVYRLKYAAGSATATEVLEAITLQTKAQTNYYSDDYELKRNYAKLMYSMGIDLALIYERMEKNNGS